MFTNEFVYESLADDVGNVQWELVRMSIPAALNKQEVLETLKGALRSYGAGGAKRVIRNFTVACNF
jgi:hypothetical protein